MVRKISSSQEIRDIVDSMEALRASASILQSSLAAFEKAKGAFEEKTSAMTPVDLLKEAVDVLDDKVPLLVRASAVNPKALKALDTALATFIDEVGVVDPAAAAQAAAKVPAPAAPPAPATGRPAAPAAPAESGSRAPKAQPDRLKNFMAGFAQGAEAAAANTYDPKEEDKKGYTARGYRAGREFFERTRRSKGELVDVLPPLIENLVEAGKHDEADEMRELLKKTKELTTGGPSAPAPATAAPVATTAAPAPTAANDASEAETVTDSDLGDEHSSETGEAGSADDAATADADGDADGDADAVDDGAADPSSPLAQQPAGDNGVIQSPPLDGDGVPAVEEDADAPLGGEEEREPWLDNIPGDLTR